MQVYFEYKDYQVKRPIITIGAFDGVHLGHCEILNKLCLSAAEKNGESLVLTFWPHPRVILDHDNSLKLLNTLEEKIALFEKAGIQHLVILKFTDAFSNLSYSDFIKTVLVEKLNVFHLIVGFNHHFGKNREGNYDKISEYTKIYGFTSEKLDAKYIENVKVSSSLIRNALLTGNVNLANKHLGYEYSISGKVIQGDKIGHTIGFPTANISILHDFKLIPHNGVYAVKAKVDDKIIKGMMNIGVRPTINSNANLTLEVHLFNFAADIYGKEITVYFIQWIRKEIHFNNIEQLVRQLNVDKNEISNILGV